LAPPASFAHKSGPRLWAAIYLGISAEILTMVFGSLALLAQTIPHYQWDLDMLVQQNRYIELERDLQTMQNLSGSDRAFYTGMLANRKNEVSDSIRLLAPLARTIAQGSHFTSCVSDELFSAAF